MSAFGELKNQLIAAIFDRDEAAFRTTLVQIMTDETPDAAQGIVFQALETVAKKENSIEAHLWARQVAEDSSPVSSQEEMEKMQQIRKHLLEEFQAVGYEEFIDFVSTPLTIYLLNKSISQNLENVMETHQWKWLNYAKIIRLNVPEFPIGKTMKKLIADIEYYCYSSAQLTIIGTLVETMTLKFDIFRDENAEIVYDLDNYYSPKKMLLMFLHSCQTGGIVLRSLTDEIDEKTGLTIKELRGYFFSNDPDFLFEKQSPTQMFAAQNTDHQTREPLPLESDVRYC